MKFLCVIFALLSFSGSAQSETDSIFYFDYRMNFTSPDDPKFVSRKTQQNDSVFVVETKRPDTSRFNTRITFDSYTFNSEKKFIIERTFSEDGKTLPGNYRILVEILDSVNGMYTMKLFSRELNINKTVISKVLAPICPIEKTIFYHPNSVISRVYYHENKVDSLFNAHGDQIEPYWIEDDVDTMPVISSNTGHSFETQLSYYVREHVYFPNLAREAELQGRIYFAFIITRDGKIEHVEVINSIHPLIDNVGLDIFSRLPIEKPAMKDGEPVDFHVRKSLTFEVQ